MQSHSRHKLTTTNLSEKSSIQDLSYLDPGPGQYDIRTTIGAEASKKTMAGRFKVDLVAKEHNQKPGPGQYSPNSSIIQKNATEVKIGTSSREQYYLKDKYKYQLPPPNVYNPKMGTVIKNSPSTGFGYGDRPSLN